MNPEWPHREEEWQEALSAHLDGELEGEQRETVECALREDPTRAGQFDEMCTLQTAVRSWNVEDDAEGKRRLLDRLRSEGACRESRQSGRRAALRIPSFAAGVLFGAAAAVLVFYTLGFERPRIRNGTVVTPAIQVTNGLDVTKQQADALLQEIAANKLKSEIFLHLQARDWTAADHAYKKMEAEYADTESLRDLRSLESTQVLKRYRVTRKGGDGHV